MTPARTTGLLKMLAVVAVAALAWPLFSLATTPVKAARPKLVLTQAEKEWISQHPVIRVGGPKAFPPFHFYTESGDAQGIGVEELEVIAQQLGLKLDYQKAMPWPEVLRRIKAKELDLIACTAFSKERAAFLSYSHSYLDMPMVIITRKGSTFVAGPRDLEDKKVALIKRVPTAKWLQRDGVWVDPVWVDTPLDALRAVSRGKAEACIENLAAASYLIQKNGLANLKIAAPTSWGEYKLYFAARKDWPTLSTLLSKALAVMPPEKLTQIRNRYIVVRYEYGIKPADVVRWAAMVGIPLALLALFFLYHNRRLRREITERIKAEQKANRTNRDLQQALADIKQLSGLLPICSACKSIRDDKGYWTEVEQYMSEHTGAKFSHSLCPDCAKKLYPELADRLFKHDEEQQHKKSQI